MATYVRYPAGDAAAGDVTTNPTFETQAALTYYVDAAGSDSNPGTLALPFLTIQKAIDSLPRFVNHAVLVSVGAGNFAGFTIDAFLLKSLLDAGGTLTIRGTMQLATLASGLSSGTIVSAAAGSASTTGWGTFSVTAGSWTTDDLRSRFVYIPSGTGSGQIRAIKSNTNANPGVATILGNWTAPTGSAFQIVESATIINASPTGVTSPTYYVLVNEVLGGNENISSPTNKMPVTIEQLRFNSGGSLTNSMYVNNSKIRIQYNEFRNTTTNLDLRGGSGRFAVISDNIFKSGAGVLVNEGWTAQHVRNVYDSTTFGMASMNALGNSDMSLVDEKSNYYYAVNNSSGALLAAAGSIIGTGVIIDGVTAGTKTGLGLGDTSPGNVKLASSSISNCAVGVKGAGPISKSLLLNTVSGSGNTTGIQLVKGNQCQINSATSLTGTTEISIDGTATTLAVMRAETPKIITTIYGTSIYE